MIRGTTAQFRFNMPYPFKELDWATVKFWQEGNDGTPTAPLPITKKLGQCTSTDDPYELCVSLTSEETMRFSDERKAKVQLRAHANGSTFASRETLITVYPINDDIVTDDPELPAVDEGWVILDGSTVI
jgi:hypothetical protein